MILHLSHRFFNDAFTFIFNLLRDTFYLCRYVILPRLKS